MSKRLFPHQAFTLPPYRSAARVCAGRFCSAPLVLTALVSEGSKVSPRVIYLPPTYASLTAVVTPPPATLWRVIYINYSAMVGGAAPVNPRPRSARGGAVCFSYYNPFFLAYNGVVNGLVLRLALLSVSHRAFVIRVWHIRGEPRTPCRVSEAFWVKIVSFINIYCVKIVSFRSK